jgi:hypothetical protein
MHRWTAHRAYVHTSPAADAFIGVGSHTAVFEPETRIHGAHLYAGSLLTSHADNWNIKLLVFELQNLDPGEPGIGHAKVLHGTCNHAPSATSAFLRFDHEMLTPYLHKSITLFKVPATHYPMKKVV